MQPLQQHPGVMMPSTSEAISIKEYLDEATSEQQELITQLAAATLPICNKAGQQVGNGVAITNNLILVAAECVQAGPLYIPGYIDGSTSGSEDEQRREEKALPIRASIFFGQPGDAFRVLSVNTSLEPIPLSIDPQPEGSVQMQWNPKIEDFTINRLDILPNELQPHQESGAPIMSKYGRVYAIRKSDSTQLKIKDVYYSLKKATGGKDEQRQYDAAEILRKAFPSKKFDITIQVNNNELECGHYRYRQFAETILTIWPDEKAQKHQSYRIHPPASDQTCVSLVKYLSREWFRTSRCPNSLSAKVSNIQYELTKMLPNKSPPAGKIQQRQEEKTPR